MYHNAMEENSNKLNVYFACLHIALKFSFKQGLERNQASSQMRNIRVVHCQTGFSSFSIVDCKEII